MGGFTLMELMIAVVVAGVLASLAMPAFFDTVRKSRRSEAFAALMAAQQAQERWRANNASYASDLSAAPPAGLGIAATTGGGLYTISLANTGATGYDAVATAVSGTTQADDTNCTKLAVRMNNGNLTYAGASLTYANTNVCWNR